MASIFLLGSRPNALEYIQNYITQYNIPSFDVENFEDVKVDDVRQIKKKLSLKSTNDRLFSFNGEITIEAQNALLKSIEEHSSSVHFIFSAEKEDHFLPTIRSRCFFVHLGGSSDEDSETERTISLFCSKAVCDWGLLDEIVDRINEKGIGVLILALRNNIRNNLEDTRKIMRYYDLSKELLRLLPLMDKNNLAVRTLVEKTFLPNA